MRILGLIIILITAAFTSAQTSVMQIHQKDGSIDSINCSWVSPDVGVTFSETKMWVGVDTVNGIPNRSVLWFCTGQIDSITFYLKPAPINTFTKYPVTVQRISNKTP